MILRAAGWLLLAASGIAAAQQYPAKPIRVVVPFPSGGPSDIVGRVVSQKLSEAWSQPVIVDNRAGAGGVIGTEYVAKGPADG
ncbi:MAG TPA: tripartite tricarboxylate transporter substrate-binding protein, partial [Burkholderiales bacterium]|nr:tripartite tricarboxylate transporter substrate-binding protein [Burkholderiales bacterium]